MKKALIKGMVAHMLVYSLVSLPLLFVTSDAWMYIIRLLAAVAASATCVFVFMRSYERVRVVKVHLDEWSEENIERMIRAVDRHFKNEE